MIGLDLGRRACPSPRPTYQQDLWHYTIARMVDICVANGILAYYGLFDDIKNVVAWAKRVIEELGDGTGAVMIDSKMQDDATLKQCRVVVELARTLSSRDPELAEEYGL